MSASKGDGSNEDVVHARRRVMESVASRGNRSTELAFAELLRQFRIWGWRRHVPILGHPDFAFRDKRVLVFLDGCFWHGCPRCYRAPVANRDYWRKKVVGNRLRDRRQRRLLRLRGWTVLSIWEHCMRRPASVLARLKRVGLCDE
jgi:DNA mismatch endonuclease, patch repair protein